MCLFCTTPDLVIARLIRTSTPHQVLEDDLFTSRSPRMRKYSILRNLIIETLDQAEITISGKLQKTHCYGSISGNPEGKVVSSEDKLVYFLLENPKKVDGMFVDGLVVGKFQMGRLEVELERYGTILFSAVGLLALPVQSGCFSKQFC